MTFHQTGPVGLVLLHNGELLRVANGGRVGERHGAQPVSERQGSLLEVVRRAHEFDLIERRPIRLDRENRFDAIGPRVCHRPSESAGLRMGHENGRPDPVD